MSVVRQTLTFASELHTRALDEDELTLNDTDTDRIRGETKFHLRSSTYLETRRANDVGLENAQDQLKQPVSLDLQCVQKSVDRISCSFDWIIHWRTK